MNNLNNLVQTQPDILLSTLDQYEISILQSFLEKTDNNYLESADMWLNASASSTAKFGGNTGLGKLYRDKVVKEIEKFFCGGIQYDEDRKKINAQIGVSQKYVICVMSTAIGRSLGVAGTFIAPVIVLIIISIGKMALNAWCEMRKELNDTQSTTE